MRQFKSLGSWLTLLAVLTLATAKKPQYEKLPALREQAKLTDSWTKYRVDDIPELLEKYGVDAWLMSQKEYAEDTVFWSLKPATAFSARRRTMQLYLRNTTGPSSYTWIDNMPTIWSDLLDVLETTQPSKIAINVDSQIAFASGLHAGEFELLISELGPEWASKLVNVPMLAVEFVGKMPAAQMQWYEKLMSTSWSMISTAFSEAVIEPGVTTTADVEWWLREQIQAWNYTTWFMGDIEVLHGKESVEDRIETGISTRDEEVIRHGDVLHCDFGVTALGMNTDTQHLAYVLHPGESAADVPKGLKEGLKKVNRLQDIVRKEMVIGMSGNEILENALNTMRMEGIEGMIYSHPIGDWGHSAGTLIGMTNLQNGVPILGDLPLLKHTYYSIELYAEHFVPERNETINFYQEEDVYWNTKSQTWEWVWGRQEEFHLIHTKAKNGAIKQHIREGFEVQELKK